MEVLCLVACWEVSGCLATETWTQGGCGPCGGGATSHHGRRGRVLCDGWILVLEEEDRMDDEGEPETDL